MNATVSTSRVRASWTMAGIKPSAPNLALSRMPFIESRLRVLEGRTSPAQSSPRESGKSMQPGRRSHRPRLDLGKDVQANPPRRKRSPESEQLQRRFASDPDRNHSWFHRCPCSSIESLPLQDPPLLLPTRPRRDPFAHGRLAYRPLHLRFHVELQWR